MQKHVLLASAVDIDWFNFPWSFALSNAFSFLALQIKFRTTPKFDNLFFPSIRMPNVFFFFPSSSDMLSSFEVPVQSSTNS